MQTLPLEMGFCRGPRPPPHASRTVAGSTLCAPRGAPAPLGSLRIGAVL